MLRKYDGVSKRKISSKMWAWLGGGAGWGETDTILSEKKLNPHGKSAAALQMVGAVKVAGGIFRFTMQQGEARGAIPRPTVSTYLSHGKSYLKSAISGEI